MKNGDCFCWQEHCSLWMQEEMGHLSYLKGWSWEIWSSWKDTSLRHQKNLQILVPKQQKQWDIGGVRRARSHVCEAGQWGWLWEVWAGTWWKGLGKGGHCFQAAEEWAGEHSPECMSGCSDFCIQGSGFTEESYLRKESQSKGCIPRENNFFFPSPSIYNTPEFSEEGLGQCLLSL